MKDILLPDRVECFERGTTIPSSPDSQNPLKLVFKNPLGNITHILEGIDSMPDNLKRIYDAAYIGCITRSNHE